jgi:hypothetical protein
MGMGSPAAIPLPSTRAKKAKMSRMPSLNDISGEVRLSMAMMKGGGEYISQRSAIMVDRILNDPI